MNHIVIKVPVLCLVPSVMFLSSELRGETSTGKQKSVAPSSSQRHRRKCPQAEGETITILDKNEIKFLKLYLENKS